MLKRNYATTTAQIGKQPEFVINQPHFLQQVDWADVIDDYQKSVKEEKQWQRAEDFAKALQSGDEEAIGQAWAAADPKSYAERLDELKEARIKREQALADAEAEHNRAIALEQLKNNLGIKKDEAAYEKELALEKLKRDWSREDKSLERQYNLEDKSLERQYELEDAEAKYNRDVSLEEHKSNLGLKKDEAAFKKELALENLKRNWNVEDAKLKREQDVEDAELKFQREKTLKQIGLDSEDTAEMKNIKYLMDEGFSLDEATKLAFEIEEGQTLTPYDKELQKQQAKADVERQVSQQGFNEIKDKALAAIERAKKALKSGTGLGYLGGLASEYGISTQKGQENRADIETANKQMNLVIRQSLKNAGVQSKELDAAEEAAAYRYNIDPRDDERTALRKIESFEKDFFGKKQPTKAQQKKPVKILSITEEK